MNHLQVFVSIVGNGLLLGAVGDLASLIFNSEHKTDNPAQKANWKTELECKQVTSHDFKRVCLLLNHKVRNL